MSDNQKSAAASGTVARTIDAFPVIPGYTIRRELGRGGMAVVYLAEQHSLKRHVAIKTIKPEFVRDEGYLQRFKDEGNWLAKLESNNTILPIYAIGGVRRADLDQACASGAHGVAMIRGSWDQASRG